MGLVSFGELSSAWKEGARWGDGEENLVRLAQSNKVFGCSRCAGLGEVLCGGESLVGVWDKVRLTLAREFSGRGGVISV